jgi:hypothetical protein
MSTESTQPSRLETRHTTEIETVEQFLARGGRIERIEEYPDPEGVFCAAASALMRAAGEYSFSRREWRSLSALAQARPLWHRRHQFCSRSTVRATRI